MSSGPTLRMLRLVGLTLGASACADVADGGGAVEEAAPLAQATATDLTTSLDRNGTYRVARYRAGFPQGEHHGEVNIYYRPTSPPKLLYAMSDLGNRSFGSPRAKTAFVGRFVMAWEKTFLEGDARYRDIVRFRGPNVHTWLHNLSP